MEDDLRVKYQINWDHGMLFCRRPPRFEQSPCDFVSVVAW
jgi:hypothetical protein